MCVSVSLFTLTVLGVIGLGVRFDRGTGLRGGLTTTGLLTTGGNPGLGMFFPFILFSLVMNINIEEPS